MPSNVGHVAHAKSEEEAKALIEKLRGGAQPSHSLSHPLQVKIISGSISLSLEHLRE